MSDATVIRACDVLNQATKGHKPLTDEEILADCPLCTHSVTLASCRVEKGKETTYWCNGCGSPLVIIGAPNPDGKPWPGRGYRVQDFVVRNAVDLRYRGVLMPRSPHALDPAR